MARTCIICGDRAGSAEHVFPAALGGRRTNRGIYCGPHNGAYSPLADIIKEQLAIFNAQLGVIGDHSKEETAVTMTEVGTNRPITMTASDLSFKSQVHSQESLPDGSSLVKLSFSSQAEADQWIAAQRALGNDVKIQGEIEKVEYYPSTMHKQVSLGGTEEGLRSIAYIAQTFLAQAFPEIARGPEMQSLKNYTLLNVGSGFVWWEFNPPNDLPTPPYDFGHRIIVGHDSGTGTVYSRISLFGSLNFALVLGVVPSEVSRAVITDIDPLARHAPNDVQSAEFTTAIGVVTRPADPTKALGEAVRSGQAQREIHDLMLRIREFELQKAAAEIFEAVVFTSNKPEAERKADLAKIVQGQSQRLLMVLRLAASEMGATQANDDARQLSDLLSFHLRSDPDTESGLSAEAARSLDVVRPALVKQLDQELADGTLDQDRLAMLIGGGPGACTMMSALISKLVG